jgi:hypothetical protein
MVSPPDDIYRAFLENVNLYNVNIIYYPPDDAFYKIETYSGENSNEGFNTILSRVLKIYIQTSLNSQKRNVTYESGITICFFLFFPLWRYSPNSGLGLPP